MKIYINGVETNTTQTNLKDELINHGMNFPCNGKGICGKCKVTCSDLAATELDKRFLSDNQINDGTRLACDKKTKDGIKVFFEKNQYSSTNRKLEYCNIAVSIDSHTIKIGILEDDIVEERVFPNLLQNSQNKKIYLRSIIAKESIEFFEKYGVAKADTIALSSSKEIVEMLLDQETDGFGDNLDALDFALPAETLYILPFYDNEISGDFLCYAVMQPAFSLIIKAGNDFIAGLMTDEQFLCIKHCNIDYETDLPALLTSIKFLLKDLDRFPIIKIYGQKADQLKPALTNYSFNIEDDISDINLIAEAINDNRIKNQIYKLRRKISLTQTVQNSEWQDLFVLSADNCDNRHNPIF